MYAAQKHVNVKKMSKRYMYFLARKLSVASKIIYTVLEVFHKTLKSTGYTLISRLEHAVLFHDK